MNLLPGVCATDCESPFLSKLLLVTIAECGGSGIDLFAGPRESHLFFSYLAWREPNIQLCSGLIGNLSSPRYIN